jgi:hypothetical protein
MVTGTRIETPPTVWRDPLVLQYPHGMRAVFDPRGRFLKPGDLVNGYVLDRFEVERDAVVAVLRYH